MKIPIYLYEQFTDMVELFKTIDITLSVLETDKKEELFPKINDNVVLTRLVYRFLVYIQISLWRVLDISEAILDCWDKKNISPSFILLRALYENASVIYDANIRLDVLIKEGQFQPIHNLIVNLTYSTKKEDELEKIIKIELERIKNGIGDFNDEDEIRKVFTARQILSVIDKINKSIPDYRNDYDNLSEYAHPNYDGMQGLYGRWLDDLTVKVSNENGVNEINVNNFFTRFFYSLKYFTEAYNGIILKFNPITEIAKADLKKKGREDEDYKLPM